MPNVASMHSASAARTSLDAAAIGPAYTMRATALLAQQRRGAWHEPRREHLQAQVSEAERPAVGGRQGVGLEPVAGRTEQRQRHIGRQYLAPAAAEARQRTPRVHAEGGGVGKEDEVGPDGGVARDHAARDLHTAPAVNESARACLPPVH